MVAFHFAPHWAPGGFVGVDVFFVISGYLMTRIIEGRLREGRFRLGDFYLARLRRIWPALVALCAVLAVVGAVAIDPWAYGRMAGELPAALFFVSNFVFAAQSGYFVADARADWLRHTWSLSVEWQFYLLYPLVLMTAFAIPAARRRLWWVVAGLALASFIASVVGWTQSSTTSFYLLPTRAWELLAGALAAPLERGLRLSAGRRGAAHALGLALIGVGAVAARGAGWPSPVALLPVGGAALVIVAAAPRSFWAESAPALWTGRASYSIYLWHWPLIVGLRYAQVPLTAPVAALALAAMFGAGFVSYLLIERRATDWIFAARRWRWSLGAAGVAVVVALALAASHSNGFEPTRTANLPAPVRAALAADRAAPDDWGYPSACGHLGRQGPLRICQLGDPSARQVAVIGDSHAEQFAPRWGHAFDGRASQGLTFLTHDACLPIPGFAHGRSQRACPAWSKAAFDWVIASGFQRVAIASSWLLYFDTCDAGGLDCSALPERIAPGEADAVFARLAEAVVRLRAAGIEVVLIGPTPRADAAGPEAIYRTMFWSDGLGRPAISRAEFEARAALVRRGLAAVSALTGAPLVDPLDSLCPGGQCPVVGADGAALFKDTGHYRASAVKLPMFAFLDRWLASGSAQPTGGPMRLK